MALLSTQGAGAGAAITFASAAGGGDTWTCTGKERLLIKNGSGAPITVTIATQNPDNYGETHDDEHVVAAGATYITPQLSTRRFADADGVGHISYSGVTSLTDRRGRQRVVAMAVQLDTNGLDRLLRDLDDILDAGAEAGADVVARLAKQNAPVDSGELRDSIKQEAAGPRTREISAGDGLPDVRAVAQEFGTRYSPAQPYLMPAATDASVAEAAARAIQERIK